MKFYSTEHRCPPVNLEEAVMNGLAPDGGLYMPEHIPRLPDDFFKKAETMSFQDIAYTAGKNFFMPDISHHAFRDMVNEAFNFDVPLIQLDTKLYVLELFHGPTCAFKDFAARLMARLIGLFAEKSQRKITILVATSGDTGSAIAHGFLNVKGIEVVILYPKGKVSQLQEKQLTSMGSNITALEVDGTFDDCQKMAKEALSDEELRQKITLASANSINIARLIPQAFYYLYLYSRLNAKADPLVISVPSGNFGNLTAGIIAKRMGAPIEKFVASTNRNDVVPSYLKTGNFTPHPSQQTISNAMDVGNPSNFARMLDLFDYDVTKMRSNIHGAHFSDEETEKAMARVFKEYDYIMDPHGAVAYLGLKDFMENVSSDVTGVFLETAHPAKFSDTVEKAIGRPVPIPDRLKEYVNRKKEAVSIKNTFRDLKNFLLQS